MGDIFKSEGPYFFIHVHVHDPIAPVDGVSGIGIGSDVIDLDYSTSGLQKSADVGWKLVVLMLQYHVAGPRCELQKKQIRVTLPRKGMVDWKECLPLIQTVNTGLIPGRVKPNIIKLVSTAFPLTFSITRNSVKSPRFVEDRWAGGYLTRRPKVSCILAFVVS